MPLRILLGFVFVYLISGFPLARLFLPDEKKISLKLILTSFAFSLFLTYPAGVLTTIIEGQSAQAIYSIHLPYSLLSLGILFFITLILLVRRNRNWWKVSIPKINLIHTILILIIALYSCFAFWNLGRADVVGDDYDLGYQAYNLQDGIQAARKAYILSFTTHPPLFMTIKHYGMQLFSPDGLETLSDWMFRGVEGMMGVGTILAVYLLISKFHSKKTALLAALFMAVNNYLIFFGRYFEREVYYLPFIVLSFYYYLEFKLSLKLQDLILVGIFLGCALLVKTSALIAVPPVILLILADKKSRNQLPTLLLTLFVVYLPVLVFNILMYLNSGYLDGTFSRIFHTYHPLLTTVPQNSFLVNPVTIFFLLSDLYGYPIMFLYLASLVTYFIFRPRSEVFKIMLLTLAFSLLFFMFSPMRAYYLIIFTIPLVVFFAEFVRKFVLIACVVLVFSIPYAYQSNLVSHKLNPLYSDIGSGGNYSILKDNFWHSEFSLAATTYSPETGWKTLKSNVDAVFRPGDCLELESETYDLAIRYYLQTHDLVKQALLKNAYQDRYPLCKNQRGRSLVIYYNSQGKISLR